MESVTCHTRASISMFFLPENHNKNQGFQIPQNYIQVREPNLYVFDHRTAVMDSNYSPENGNGNGDFGFAFNDSNFSDRVLRIEIISEPPECTIDGDGDGCTYLTDWARNRKRRREDIKNENLVDINVAAEYPEEQVLNQPDDGVDPESQDEEPAAMIEESPSDSKDNDSNWRVERSKVLKVKTLHISSPILAARSPFFYKLFSDGMQDLEQHYVTLRVNVSEEAALMELLNFMYSNTLTVTTAPALFDVLMAADKFEVSTCMRYCSRLLKNLPMTAESALLYLDLQYSGLKAEAVKPLMDAAKLFLGVSYKDLSKFENEVLKLPIDDVEAILSSDDLQVASEDAVYDFVLKWARIHFPKLKDRRVILTTRLAHCIRFPYMTCRKLKKVLTCNDFDHDFAQKAVIEALFFKTEAPHKQQTYVTVKNSINYHWFVERPYKCRPVKVVEFEQPRQQCVVYLDLKHDECASLFPSKRVYSQAFHMGGQGFFLSAHCNMDQQSSFHCFGFFLGMQEKGSVSISVDYEFAARSKPLKEYVIKYKGNYSFTGGKAVGYRNLFSIPWKSFIGEESVYFIDGVLHLRAKLTIRH